MENQDVEQSVLILSRTRRKLTKGSKVVDIPKGEHLFLFSCPVGKIRPIKIFYNGGCSHVVIKDNKLWLKLCQAHVKVQFGFS